MTLRKRVAAAVATLLMAGGLSACGNESGAPSDSAAPATSAESDASFNDTDVQFAQDMIVHHRSAIEMARLAPERAEDPEVGALADRIEAAQAPEIDTMTSWLDSWGVEAPHHMSMTDQSMPGMISDARMGDLTATGGARFDRLFLGAMIEHHEGAVDMARTEISEGESPEAIDLARTIEADQTAEIAQMERLLRRL